MRRILADPAKCLSRPAVSCAPRGEVSQPAGVVVCTTWRGVSAGWRCCVPHVVVLCAPRGEVSQPAGGVVCTTWRGVSAGRRCCVHHVVVLCAPRGEVSQPVMSCTTQRSVKHSLGSLCYKQHYKLSTFLTYLLCPSVSVHVSVCLPTFTSVTFCPLSVFCQSQTDITCSLDSSTATRC